MKHNLMLSLLVMSLAGALCTASRADAVAVPVWTEAATPSSVEAGNFSSLIFSDDQRLLQRAISDHGWYACGLGISCNNPLLFPFSNFTRMEIKIEGLCSPALSQAIQVKRGNGSWADVGSMTLRSSESSQTLVLTGNVNKYIQAGGFVNVFIHGMSQDFFRRKLDKVSVRFS